MATPESFRKHIKDRYPATPPVNPTGEQQAVVMKGTFANQQRDEFFNEAFGDILADLFVAWCRTEAHCVKEREYLYATAVALGSVKGKLVDYTNMGKNTAYLAQQKAADAAVATPGKPIQEGTDNAD